MGVLSSKAECRACGAMLRQNAKCGWISSGVISFLMVFLPLVTFFSLILRPYSEHICVLNFSVMAVVLSLVAFIVGFILNPYVSKYEIDPKHNESKEKTCS
jgi:ATP/ADP translocase